MLEVTESALANIKGYLQDNNINSAIRVAMQSSCSGTSLGLVLDDKKNSDTVFNHDGICSLVDTGMFASTSAITIDYLKSSGCGCGGRSGSFSISSEKPLIRAGSCASGSCSSGSCGC